MPEESMYSQRDPIGIAVGNPSLYGYVWDSTREIDIFGLDTCPTQKISNKMIGAQGENMAEQMLKDSGWTDFVYIKNTRDNGIDIIARGPNGQLGFFEVKTTGVGRIPNLSNRQSDMNWFINNVLGDAANARGRYKNIDIQVQNAAKNILGEVNGNYNKFLNEYYNITGATIGVDLTNGNISVSRWSRK